MNSLSVTFCKPLHGISLLLVVPLILSCQQQSDKPVSTSFSQTQAISRVEPASPESLDGSNSVIIEQSSLTPAELQSWPAARYASAGLVKPIKQRPGDPVAGRKALLEGNYVNCGLPERVFRRLQGDATVTGIDDRHALADGLPFSVNVFTNDDGINVVSNNCLTCHASELFGELVVGLGNEFLDFTGDASAPVEQAGAMVRAGSESIAWELFADRISAISPFIRTATVGVNPANNLTFALIAHRDPQTNAWSDTPLLPLPPEQPAPVSVPPWWRMAKKPAMFNMAEGREDHARIMMAATMLCTDTREELEAVDAYAPDIRAYIASLKPPAYPFPIDQIKAEQGRLHFEQHCSHCHGTYNDAQGHDYPARLVPIETLQTDPMLLDFAHGTGVAYIDWFNRSYYGELSIAAPGPGYIAPPLEGVWATGPFLHNGSVPTIAAVLESAKRPRIWRHVISDTSDPESYDQNRLGWVHEILSEEELDPLDKRIYNTGRPGYTNEGHLFGDALESTVRLAILEYLKTL